VRDAELFRDVSRDAFRARLVLDRRVRERLGGAQVRLQHRRSAERLPGQILRIDEHGSRPAAANTARHTAAESTPFE